ncbi:molybdopterin oxidoreductase family protein [Streptomyces sp. N2-109]|uniref:Molybdopterin oxidoreductase family protein n=1 Tax=Streptomyces gossypii TaxID=2883101 RepID=A0ABT2JS60_9ACTN|nr:molybdopterin oxidoreductase family protein [Streptomyces gossypii]MCT2590329.1 molybdopterin oxidoreductase family protein [Streptomyces gossypii]
MSHIPQGATSTPDLTETHCPYCSLQCGMNLQPVTDDDTELPGGPDIPAPTSIVDGTGRPQVLLKVTRRADFPVNRGALCTKGHSAPTLLSSPSRLTGPLVRDRVGGKLRPAGWAEALDRAAAGLSRTRAAHGSDAVGVFGGGGLTNEKAYLLGKFARLVLGTSQIDYNGRFCMSSAAAASNLAFGLDRGMPFPLADIPRTGCVILVGSNLAETMPPALRYFTELRKNGGKLIVVDPRRTKTAAQADLHLAPRPGTDLALALGLLHLVVAEGRTDQKFIDTRTTGWPEARSAAMAHWPELVERITGVPLPALREAVALFCDAASSMVLTARGPEQQAKGTDTVGAWINLCLATGRAGRPYSGYGCLTGQGNGQGGREHGQKADQLPGYRKLTDPAARAHVAGVWGVDPDSLPGPGRSAYELLDALGGDGDPGAGAGADADENGNGNGSDGADRVSEDERVRALLLMGSNPVVSAPRAAHVEARIRSLDFLVVADVVLSETAALADVVLPVTQWAEETGTMTNLEGRVLLRRRAVEPPAGVRTDLEVLHALAARLGWEKGFPSDPEEVFDELRRASAGGLADYSGITYRRIAEGDGLFWPCPETPVTGVPAHGAAAAPDGAGATAGHQGTPRLFLERFATADGRARFAPVTHRPAAEEPDADYPVRLTTGRVMAQYQSGAQTRRIDSLNNAAPGPFVQLHPHLAERVGAVEGAPLAVVSRRGRAVGPARISADIRADTVFMPFHWPGEGRVNTVTNPALDPTSGMPEFKVCAVRLEPVLPAAAPDSAQ